MPAHGLHQLQRAGKIVVVIFQRLFDGFANGLQAREVNHRVDRLSRESDVQRLRVAQIALNKRKILAGNLADAVQRLRFGVAEVIDDDNLMSFFQQFHAGMAANIARAARNKNFHVFQSPFLPHHYNPSCRTHKIIFPQKTWRYVAFLG